MMPSPALHFTKNYEKSFLSQVEKMLSLASSSKECIITFHLQAMMCVEKGVSKPGTLLEKSLLEIV